MNITQKETGNLTATITVEVTPDDYKELVDKTLRSYKRIASIPGFRKGKVPFSVINKMYGRAVLIDEVLKVTADSLSKYIDENKLEIFGSPLINDEKAEINDWDKNENFIFEFDIALIPKFEPEIDHSIKIQKYNIKPKAEDIEKYIDDIRERYGKFEQAEKVAEGQFINAELIELNEDKSEKKVGLRKPISFWVHDCNEELKKLILGLKKEEKADFIIEKLYPDLQERSEFFLLQQNELDKANGLFALKIIHIISIIPAELNEELYAKVFPFREIKSEEDLRAAIEEDLTNTYNKEANRQFFYEVQDAIKEKFPVEIPEEFLKRWMKKNAEKKFTDEDIEKAFPSYVKHLQWQVIENKLIKKYELKIEEDEFRQYIKEVINMGNVNEEENPEAKALIDQVIQSIVQNKDDIKRIYDAIYEQKLTALFNEKCTIEEKTVTWKEFLNLVVQKNEN